MSMSIAIKNKLCIVSVCRTSGLFPISFTCAVYSEGFAVLLFTLIPVLISLTVVFKWQWAVRWSYCVD